MQKEIIVDITPDGKVKIEAVGYSGNACEKATAAIEAALGVVKSRKRKPEYQQKQVTGQKAGQA